METKVCYICGEMKGVIEFSANQFSKDGIRHSCKLCDSKNKLEKCAEREMRSDEMIMNVQLKMYPDRKTCFACGKGKSFSEYYSYPKLHDG